MFFLRFKITDDGLGNCLEHFLSKKALIFLEMLFYITQSINNFKS